MSLKGSYNGFNPNFRSPKDYIRIEASNCHGYERLLGELPFVSSSSFPILEILLQWKGLLAFEYSWKAFEVTQKKIHDIPLEEKVFGQGY